MEETPQEFRLPRLPAELDELAAGMDQQAVAARTGTALGGHSDPFHFFGRVAFALRAAASQIRSDHPAPPVSKAASLEVDPPQPPEPGEKAPTPVSAQPPSPAKGGKR